MTVMMPWASLKAVFTNSYSDTGSTNSACQLVGHASCLLVSTFFIMQEEIGTDGS